MHYSKFAHRLHRKASRSRLRRRQIFKQQEFFKKQEDFPSAEVKEKGGFSYVELNEKKSPGGETVLANVTTNLCTVDSDELMQEAAYGIKLLNELGCMSPFPGPGGESTNSWASGLASGLAAVAATPFGNR